VCDARRENRNFLLSRDEPDCFCVLACDCVHENQICIATMNVLTPPFLTVQHAVAITRGSGDG
jgi:hypothetical protein